MILWQIYPHPNLPPARGKEKSGFAGVDGREPFDYFKPI
jgi:hypothetical protein